MPTLRQCSVIVSRQVDEARIGLGGPNWDFASQKRLSFGCNGIADSLDSDRLGLRVERRRICRQVPVEIKRGQLLPDLTQIPKLNDPVPLQNGESCSVGRKSDASRCRLMRRLEDGQSLAGGRGIEVRIMGRVSNGPNF